MIYYISSFDIVPREKKSKIARAHGKARAIYLANANMHIKICYLVFLLHSWQYIIFKLSSVQKKFKRPNPFRAGVFNPTRMKVLPLAYVTQVNLYIGSFNRHAWFSVWVTWMNYSLPRKQKELLWWLWTLPTV